MKKWLNRQSEMRDELMLWGSGMVGGGKNFLESFSQDAKGKALGKKYN